MKPIVLALAVCIVAGLMAGQARASEIVFIFGLDGSQEVPPVTTSATGDAVVTYNTETRLLSWEVNFSGFDQIYPVSDAHFHGPADFGVNAPPVVGMSEVHATAADNIIQDDVGEVEGAFIGSHTLTASQEAELLDHLWYINIHSTLYPAGEIRGQVIPEPASLALVGVAGLLLMKRRRR